MRSSFVRVGFLFLEPSGVDETSRTSLEVAVENIGLLQVLRSRISAEYTDNKDEIGQITKTIMRDTTPTIILLALLYIQIEDFLIDEE